MSHQAVSWVLNHPEPQATADRFILVVIAEHADEQGGNSYPGAHRIAAMTGLSERWVRERLTALAKEGHHLTRTRRARFREGKRIGGWQYVYEIQMNSREPTSGDEVGPHRKSGGPHRNSVRAHRNSASVESSLEPSLQPKTSEELSSGESQNQDADRVSLREYLVARGHGSAREAIAAGRQRDRRTEFEAP